MSNPAEKFMLPVTDSTILRFPAESPGSVDRYQAALTRMPIQTPTIQAAVAAIAQWRLANIAADSVLHLLFRCNSVYPLPRVAEIQTGRYNLLIQGQHDIWNDLRALAKKCNDFVLLPAHIQEQHVGTRVEAQEWLKWVAATIKKLDDDGVLPSADTATLLAHYMNDL